MLRVYYVPPPWLLDLAAQHGLRLMVDVPWAKHLCFFESYDVQVEARKSVREAARRCQGHPALFALSVVNEIPSEIVRWSGPARCEKFIDELIGEAKSVDSACLCTFASFPPTEFLAPRTPDFLCFNVYLHQPEAFGRYLARLQMIAATRPLLLGEFGLDSVRQGEEHKCRLLGEQIQVACGAGLAGAVLFSFTDDWHRGGRQVDDWAFGLTTTDRRPKPSFSAVQKLYQQAPYLPLPRSPKVSVVVASYNGARTLDACLSSLTRLNYPDYEVILVDDGSTDNTQEVAARYPSVRNVRQSNQGLSAARNAGIRAATGEVVAFTDSDCRADEDWLFYLVGDMVRGGFTGMGGHNFLPPEDSAVAAAVMASPGGPTHVMLTDQEAEHIPGCNMAFYKWALEEIHGFDPVFRKAGDDVDVCWRLQQRGHKLGFSSAGFVWHYRRSTARAYLKQQAGYGEAEALLVAKHPEYFSVFGGGIWRGRIYGASKYGLALRPNLIYHGTFGSGFFQRLYSAAPSHVVMLLTSLPFYIFVTLPLILLAVSTPLLLVPAVISVVASLGVCVAAAIQADLPREKTRVWSRPLVAGLHFLQPIVRGWVRHTTRLDFRFRRDPRAVYPSINTSACPPSPQQLCFWNRRCVDRYGFLQRIIQRLHEDGSMFRTDSGWDQHDLQITRNRWTALTLTTVDEYLSEGRIVLRCRIQAGWSLTACLVFFAVVIAQLLLLYFLHAAQPWIWLILPVFLLVAWYFDDERCFQQMHLAKCVEETTQDLNLEIYPPISNRP